MSFYKKNSIFGNNRDPCLRFNLIKVKGDNARTSFVGKLDLQSSCSADLTLPHAPTYLDWLGWGWTLLTVRKFDPVLSLNFCFD